MTDLELASAAPAPAARARRFSVRSALGWAVVAALFAVLVVFRPVSLGGSTHFLFIAGASMEPTMRTGDLVLLEPAAAYAVGDVVAYHPVQAPDGTIIHRIVGGDAASGFVIRGDNRTTDDYDRPTPDALMGRMILHLPAVGWLLGALQQPLILGGIGAVLVVAFTWDLLTKRQKRA